MMATRRNAARPGGRQRPPAALPYAVVAALLLALWPPGTAGAATGPALSLDPASGPCGSRLAIRGEGLRPRRLIDLFARRTAPTPGRGWQLAEVRAGTDGAFALEEALLGCAADPQGPQFTILAMLRPADPRADS